MTAQSFGSLGAVNRAGDTLRRALTGEGPAPSTDEVRRAQAVVDAYRSAHAAPLRAAGMGLRSCIVTLGLEPDISGRLKKFPTIEDKLRRLPTMKLSSMQDIGGCRAVLPTQDDVNRVLERFKANSLRRNHQPDKVRDYVSQPQVSGYRAVHIYTRYQERRIEVQLRTPSQDGWAKAVENLSNRTGIDYKSGDGSKEIHELLRSLSEVQAMQEARMARSDLSQKLHGSPIHEIVQSLHDAVEKLTSVVTYAVPYLGDQPRKDQED